MSHEDDRRRGPGFSVAIDITVHLDQQLTDELILTLALTGPWISSFLQSSGGGGG